MYRMGEKKILKEVIEWVGNEWDIQVKCCRIIGVGFVGCIFVERCEVVRGAVVVTYETGPR